MRGVQSHDYGILTTNDVVYELPLVWDCTIH